jgi:hypothetical protein
MSTLALHVLLVAGCQSDTNDPANNNLTSAEFRSAFGEDEPGAFRDSIPIGPTYSLEMTRTNPSAADVIARARAMAVVITKDQSLPGGASIDPSELQYWEDAARGQPDRPGTVNVYLNNHHLSATYLPITDTLSVLSKDIKDRAPAGLIPGEKHVGVGGDAARATAEACVDELATLGVIPSRAYSRIPVQSAERVTTIGGNAWVEQYDFVFSPMPGGIPLRSMDVRVGVAAQSGRCRTLVVSLVQFEEHAAVIVATSAEAAKAAVISQILQDPVVNDVTVEGYIGYLLEPEVASAIVEPRYIAQYVTSTLVDGRPMLARRKTASVTLTSSVPSVQQMYDW